jgi:hypothetical protein
MVSKILKEPNCIGNTLWKLGVVPTDRYEDPFYSFDEHGLEEAPLRTAPALAVIDLNLDLVVHMAYFEGSDRRFVWERKEMDVEAGRVTLKESIGGYLKNGFCRVTGVRRK